ncbi:MAG: MerR family transcriptional regulator [Epulopiscium sp.]|nr:MerR family transcriptional regulator [Candidatus Epulonipiscium sp.]
MEEKRYTISEASDLLELESHVLRYWEEELNLNIPRNEMGHRYYTKKEMDIFEKIKELKGRGLQLKAIKSVLDDLNEKEENYSLKLAESNAINIANPNDERVKKFQMMLRNLFKEALVEYNRLFKEELKEDLKRDLREEISCQIRSIELSHELKEKERYRKLDEAIREVQNMRKESAVAVTVKKPWYKQVFGR